MFISTSKDTIVALNQTNGKVIWEADLGGNLGAFLQAKNGFLNTTILAGTDNIAEMTSLFRQIDPKTGVPSLIKTLGTAFLANSLLIDSNEIILSSRDGLVEKISASGNVLWQTRLLTEVLSPLVVASNRVLMGTGNKSIVALDLSTGKIVAQINIEGLVTALAVAGNGIIFAGDSTGKVFGFNSDLSQVWETKTGAGISRIKIFENDPLVSSKDNFVYRLSHSNGNRIWKRKLAGRILGGELIDEVHSVYLTSGASMAIILDLRDGSLTNSFDAGSRFVSGPVKIKNGFAMPTENKVIAVSIIPCSNN
jgi:outer membrane protein assembly factor BamB